MTVIVKLPANQAASYKIGINQPATFFENNAQKSTRIQEAVHLQANHVLI